LNNLQINRYPNNDRFSCHIKNTRPDRKTCIISNVITRLCAVFCLTINY